MRLAAQVVGGFYACAPEAVRLVAQRIKYQEGAILDPCAGEGEALATLAEGLGCGPERTYAIELERDRSQKLRERLVGAKVLGPCSCFDTRISSGTFSISFVNPPFDTNVKGGRAEIDFLARATDVLAPGGILVLIIPEHVVEDHYQEVPRYLAERFEQLAILTFPEAHRPYQEVAVIGKKRRRPVPLTSGGDFWHSFVVRGDLEACELTWEAPVMSTLPKLFEKAGLTDEELLEAVEKSPLWKLTETPPVKLPARPPLPLSRGHIALLLASGQLDGVLEPPGEQPHVVRGTATKVANAPQVAEEVLESGRVRTITTLTERIQLVVRTVTPDGLIRTLQ